MKRRTLSILIVSISLIILFLTGCVKQDKLNNKNANKNKADRFIEDITESIKRREKFNYKNKVRSYKFTDEEYIEVQNKLSEGLDAKFFNNQIDFNSNSDENIKLSIIYSMNTCFFTQWKSELSYEEIVFNKILPIVKASNDMIRYLWLDDMGYLLMDINNQKLPFSEKHRTKTMDELILIFTEEDNRKEIKYRAFHNWPYGEQREEKIYEVFNILINNDEEHFMLTGRDFARLRIKAPKLYSLMFDILEDRKQYSNKCIIGALSFFKSDAKGFYQDEGGKRKIKLKKLVQEIVENEENEEVKERAKEIFDIIKTLEKEGRY